MRLSRIDFVPVLAIVAGGVIGASLSFSFLERSRSDDVPSATVGTVTGQVIDASSGSTVAAVQVYISSFEMGGLTLQNGRYVLQNVPAGTYTLTVVRIGYRTKEEQVTVGGGQTVEQNFAVAEEAIQLGEIVVPQRLLGPDRIERVEVAIAGAERILRTRIDRFEVEETRPVFTPMTVRPRISNGDEVQAALMGEYPPILRDAGIGGTAVVWFFISEGGTVLDRRVAESSGHEQLDEAALNVANVFQFTPAMNRDERVPVWIQLPITFQVQ